MFIYLFIFFYHKCRFTFPLIQFFFHVTNLTAFGHFTKSEASDEFLLSVIVIQKLRFNRP